MNFFLIKWLTLKYNVLKIVLNEAKLHITFLWLLDGMKMEYLSQFPKL